MDVERQTHVPVNRILQPEIMGKGCRAVTWPSSCGQTQGWYHLPHDIMCIDAAVAYGNVATTLLPSLGIGTVLCMPKQAQ